MVKKTVKQMLIDLYKEERGQIRCMLVCELKEKVAIISKPYKIEMEEVQIRISSLEVEISALRKEKYAYKEDMDKEMRRKKLETFDHKSCGDVLHPRLVEFDKITNNHIREILENSRKKQ